MHIRYFFINQEKWFGLVVIICIVMSVVLALFFGYHVNLAWNNETTNESMKKKDFKSSLARETSIIKALITETDDWEPKSDAKEH